MPFSRKFLDDIRATADIVQIVGEVVELTPFPGDRWKGLCPFHNESGPSFSVSNNLYHCFAGETQVLTWEGSRPIKELTGGVHKILNRSAHWVDAPFKSYGVQPLMKITMTRNRQVKEIYVTDEHRWFVRAGRQLQTNRQKMTKDLKPGDRLSYVYSRSRIKSTTLSPFGIAHGFTYGDGTRMNGTGSLTAISSEKKKVMLQWFPNSHKSTTDGIIRIHHLPRFFKDLPSLNESTSYLFGWLAGYFAADGCVAQDGTVIFNSADREAIEFVRTLATRLGLGTFGITTQVRLGLGKEPSDLYRLHFINEDLPEEFFLLDDHRKRFKNNNKGFARRGWTVRSVEKTDRIEEVFCAEVEDGHAFALADNILTGNCFGCNEGGDVFRFIQQSRKLSFSQAVLALAERYNISDDPNAPRPQIRRAKPFVAGFKPPEGYVAPSSIPLLTYDEETRKLWENRRAEVDPFYTEPNHEELTTGFVAPGLVRELLEALQDG